MQTLGAALARDSGGVASEFDTLQDIRRAFPDDPWADVLFVDYLV